MSRDTLLTHVESKLLYKSDMISNLYLIFVDFQDEIVCLLLIKSLKFKERTFTERFWKESILWFDAEECDDWKIHADWTETKKDIWR